MLLRRFYCIHSSVLQMLEPGQLFNHILRYNKGEGVKQTLKVIKLVS